MGATIAHANPSFFAPQAVSATATSTLTYIIPGTATTTIVYDAYNLNGTNQSSPSDSVAADGVTLAVQLTASSTNTALAINLEYSQDNIDWYQSELSTQATTTPVQNVTIAQSYLWAFASTTPGMGAPAGTRQMKVISVQTPVRYVRAVFTIPVGSTNGAIWAAFIPKKQGK